MKYIQPIIIIMILAATMFVSWQIYLYLGRGELTIQVNPKDVTLQIDKTAYGSNQLANIKLTPGDHTLIVAADGFKPVTQTISMGWQDTQTTTLKLNPKPFKDIYQNLSPDITYTDYTVEQEKFFLNNTWAAGYIVSGDESDIAVAVLKREYGAWKLVVHTNEPVDTSSGLPAPVYDYVKEFQR